MSRCKLGIMYRLDDLRIIGQGFRIIKVKVHRILKTKIEISYPEIPNDKARGLVEVVRNEDI